MQVCLFKAILTIQRSSACVSEVKTWVMDADDTQMCPYILTIQKFSACVPEVKNVNDGQFSPTQYGRNSHE